MRKIFFVVIPILIAISVAIYAFLGGFKAPDIKVAESSAFILAGTKYRGHIQDDSLINIYKQTSKFALEGTIPGTFCVRHFVEPDMIEGKVNSLIGIIVADSNQSLPVGFKYYMVKGGKMIKAEIKTHYSVAPRPETVNEMIRNYGTIQKLKLDSGSIEKYVSSNLIVVEVPIVGEAVK